MNYAALRPLVLVSALAWGAVTCAPPGQAQEPPISAPAAPAEALSRSQILFNAPPPPRQGTPGGRSQGGASRGPCQDFAGLTALVPTTDGVVWGQTTQAAPSLWVYLPHPLSANTPLELTLQDANDNYLYATSLEADTSPGLIQFEIAPETPLQPDQLYTWTLVISCDPAQPTESVFVNGTLQPVPLAPGLQAQMAVASKLEQARLYAANGIWHDALNTLATHQQAQPASAQATSAWVDLLQQAGFEDLASEPFSPCCLP
ncbi:DUF928 domain-containing protein [Leptolyngbya sp. CCNP1308]|uniref:DUF928 domain-containing protein n=1 Tax=Leptolyngbya sp. CCNP1308 TaxID=3110255 RepID=UPI002B2025FD|nr:DUF928 domain-containing protein [Leptolyngbya sp. CCNP1308]MEA5449226.1 DUF928 domain-containing protein [Leptolyngbya sp. CCNP1308]